MTQHASQLRAFPQWWRKRLPEAVGPTIYKGIVMRSQHPLRCPLRLLAAACWLLPAHCWLLRPAGCWLRPGACGLLAAGCWQRPAGSWLLQEQLLSAGGDSLAAGCTSGSHKASGSIERMPSWLAECDSAVAVFARSVRAEPSWWDYGGTKGPVVQLGATLRRAVKWWD